MENRKKLFLISGILLVLILAALGGWLYSRNKKMTTAVPKPVTNTTDVPTSTGDKVPTPVVITTTTPSPELNAFQAQVETLTKTDQDLDGLSDVEEKTYSTSPTSSDTDADGLLDKDEITIFHTDPLKADTDSDGHPDGEEVRNGYNPNGPGKLIANP